MSSDQVKFKFVSPGVFVEEVDQSQLEALPARMGPVIIGRAERGPAMKPVTVNSFSEFVETFGAPIPGGRDDDPWRNGNYSGPTYGAYAAQAYLKNSSPITFVRLLGKQHNNPTTAGQAGWQTSSRVTTSTGTNGGAYGLWVVPSGSTGNAGHLSGSTGHEETATGSLAAVWYLEQGTVELTGTLRAGPNSAGADNLTSGSAVMVQSLGGSGETTEFRVIIKDSGGSTVVNTSFNFDSTSDKHIRKVFNTNPMATNSQIYSTTEKYWLGETFERTVGEKLTGTGAGKAHGVILSLSSGSATQYEYSQHRKESINAETGWIISQDLGNANGSSTCAESNDFDALDENRIKRLFRFIALDTGEWNQRNLKVSITDIKPAKSSANWPIFSVELRGITDNDKNKQIIEKFSGLNLNPSSTNYIGRRIGTQYAKWNSTSERLEYQGDYPNQSKFMRVAVAGQEDESSRAPNESTHIPFGAWGPIRFKGFTIMSGSSGDTQGNFSTTKAPTPTFVEAAGAIAAAHRSASLHSAHYEVHTGPHALTASFKFPAVALRASASAGGIVDDTKAYFGADTTKRAAANVQFESSVVDAVRTLPGQTATAFDIVESPIDYANAERSWAFTLDDIAYDNQTKVFHYSSGSRNTGCSWTAISGTNHLLTGSTAGINKFTTVFYGGFDGLDITEREPFRNDGSGDGLKEGSTNGETANYAYHTLMRAISTVSDSEQVECNLMAIPGVTNTKITERLVRVCEERADALAVIDIENDFVPSTENTSDQATRMGDVDQAVRGMKDREIDSSYGAAYYPWVQVKDKLDGTILWCPPSVVALGAMAYSEAVKNVWFAPAGFSRGGLTATGAGGLPVVGVRQHLTSKQRDKLYDVNVNPIASFPAEGIVIFGQKTLQLTPSALDRVNVRRLLIFLKKEISRIAASTLFEQNVKETWNGFSAEAGRLLNFVKYDFGLTEYKLVLDETTTTPDLIDRNIMYAKIFLKPARAIEFIALDFIITSAGASFED